MRKPKYLSPTSISLFYSDVTEFFQKYLAENRPPRIAQTVPMAIGSSFDAYVKSFLYEKIHGSVAPEFELRTLFEKQVESQNRDKAWADGKKVFDLYQKSGSLSALLLEMRGAITEPRFEFELEGVIGSVNLLGKPDLFFRNKEGISIIHDWKVNGYYSKWGASPMEGYVRLIENGVDKGNHKNAVCMKKHGIMLNVTHRLEDLNDDWAQQLCIYAWLCGEDVGGDFVCSVDQVACAPGKIRFAEHRLKVKPEYQKEIFKRAHHIWDVIESGWIFRNLTEEQSKQKCELLDQPPDGSSLDRWFSESARS